MIKTIIIWKYLRFIRWSNNIELGNRNSDDTINEYYST